MKIYMYIVDSNDVITKYEEYSDVVKRVFECENEEYDELFQQAVLCKEKMEKKLNKMVPVKEFEEEFYDEQIDDEETKMLLSNGLYDKKELKEHLKKASHHLFAEIEDIIKDIANKRVLFWNC